MLSFRDYLRSHADEARRYGRLKKRLARTHDDADAYADGKTTYVFGVVRKAEHDVDSSGD